jgi:hypothetical protein
MAHARTFETPTLPPRPIGARTFGTMDLDLDLAEAAAGTRWVQLLMGFIVMMVISSPQYVWTLFVPSFQKTTGALLSEVQWTITILIVLQTWLARCRASWWRSWDRDC